MLQRLQASLLGSTVISDDVIGDAEQSREDACLLIAEPLPCSKGPGEHLSGKVIARL